MCLGCSNAPEYQSGDSRAMFYCGHDCQVMDWPKHKRYCKSMQRRKILLRAAQILKAAMLTYRETVYDVDITRIEYRGGVLYLHQNQRTVASRSKRGPFPNYMTDNIEHKEAALVKSQSTAAMALLGPLTRKLLRGMPLRIETIVVNIRRPRVPTRLVPGPDLHGGPHMVLKITRLDSDEEWIIDTTGCQYGFRDVLVPSVRYLTDTECRVLTGPRIYGACETKDLDYLSTLHIFNKTKAQRQDMRLERLTRHHFAVFVSRNVDDKLLMGSGADFKRKIDHFVKDLKAHMVDSIRKAGDDYGDSEDD
ncbi:uncharacterized protein N7500_007574 [Penicillium coprophilum]|uniref:uncharacterized protein n=1 Tax=Penicillium coprophilum TaxID=36646 RepID=UPI00239C62BA|nr:uncharacterized protein N7500_005302 [Penicillium coprophilum]XP_056533718.1 uncharacterized protein N7500_007574 [Penicillium coprophilum]KAJ5163472.1 hypothetical protein N7500_005302 [Penicillium coprophilum]KAJ5165744.1 hypothetical protein N7500_007574 [Penicillium coprophilum]